MVSFFCEIKYEKKRNKHIFSDTVNERKRANEKQTLKLENNIKRDKK